MTESGSNPLVPENPETAAAVQNDSRAWYRKRRWWLTGAVVLVIGIGAANGGSSGGESLADSASQSSESESQSTSASEERSPSATPDAAPEAVQTSTEPTPVTPDVDPTQAAPESAEVPDITVSQQNALKAAENYLEFMAFSRQGLIDQLSSDYGDGYSVDDATFAVDKVKVDWNEQAVKAAQNYLDMMPFSRQGLIEQLSSAYGEGFTLEQATYGVDAVGL